jgi:hypothetical protein
VNPRPSTVDVLGSATGVLLPGYDPRNMSPWLCSIRALPWSGARLLGLLCDRERANALSRKNIYRLSVTCHGYQRERTPWFDSPCPFMGYQVERGWSVWFAPRKNGLISIRTKGSESGLWGASAVAIGLGTIFPWHRSSDQSGYTLLREKRSGQ